MKNTVALLALSFAAPALVNAQDAITGTWVATGVGFAPWTFNLKADGPRLTGTVMQGATDPSGWATSLTAPTAIYDGVIDGNTISFKCDSPGGGDRTITFTGTLSGEQILFRRSVQVRPGGDPGRNGIYGATGAEAFTALRQSARAPAPADQGGQSSTHAVAPNRQSDVVETSQGPLRITPLYHGSVMLQFNGKVIHVDPWGQADYTSLPQADMILITHTHADHMDPALLKTLKKDSTIIVTSEAVNDTLNGCCGVPETIRNGEKKTFMNIEIEAVPMYNLTLGPAPGKPWHHKGIGNGYILSFGDTNNKTRVYFSGDTECVPEVKALKDISIAFVAMNPPRTMPVAEAAACVKELRPKIVYPYHYRGQNTQEFADALKGTGIEVRLRKLEGEP